MLLSALSFLVVAQSSSEFPEGLMNNPVFRRVGNFQITGSVLHENKIKKIVFFLKKARFTSEAHKSKTAGHPGN